MLPRRGPRRVREAEGLDIGVLLMVKKKKNFIRDPTRIAHAIIAGVFCQLGRRQGGSQRAPVTDDVWAELLRSPPQLPGNVGSLLDRGVVLLLVGGRISVSSSKHHGVSSASTLGFGVVHSAGSESHN